VSSIVLYSIDFHCTVIVDRTMNSSQVFDKYSESVGHLVMTEDGAVTNVSRFARVIAQFNS